MLTKKTEFFNTSVGNIKKELKKYKKKGFRLVTITALKDKKDYFLYYHLALNEKLITLKVKLRKNRAVSVSGIFSNAEIYEREAWEFLGIEFGKKMKNLFLVEGSKGELNE